MKHLLYLTLLSFLMACSNPVKPVDTLITNKADDSLSQQKKLIDSLVATINDNYDMLHCDMTHSVYKLSEMGFPALMAILPLLNNSNIDTRMHAQRVTEGIVMQYYGFVPGQGFSGNPAGEEKSRVIIESIGYDWNDTIAVHREMAIKKWLKWISENNKINSFIEKETALKIAKEDAQAVYRNLSIYDVKAVFLESNWQVDYNLTNPQMLGGGPHYIICGTTGNILKRRYEQ